MSWFDALEVGSKVICSSPTNDFTIVTISSITPHRERMCANGRTYSGKTGRAIGSGDFWYYWCLLEPTEERLAIAEQQARIYCAQFELSKVIRAFKILHATASVENASANITLVTEVLELVDKYS